MAGSSGRWRGIFLLASGWERRVAQHAAELQTTLHVAGLWLLTAMITAEVALRIIPSPVPVFHAVGGLARAGSLVLIHYACGGRCALRRSRTRR